MNDSILDQPELILYRGKWWHASADPNCRAMIIVKHLENVLRSKRPLVRTDINYVIRILELKFITYDIPDSIPALLEFDGRWMVVDSKCPEMRAVRYLETVLGRPLTRLDIESVIQLFPIKLICTLDPTKND